MMESEWDQHADSWDSCQLVQEYTDNALQSLLSLLSEQSFDLTGKRVMDYGCGTGLMSERLAPLVKEIVSIDSSAKMIEHLKEKSLTNVSALSADVDLANQQNFPVLKEKFDLIIACSVCSFLNNYERKLAFLSGLLNPGGLFVQWDWMRTDENQEFGLEQDRIANAYSKARLKTMKLDKEFEMLSGAQPMPVLMGVGQR